MRPDEELIQVRQMLLKNIGMSLKDYRKRNRPFKMAIKRQIVHWILSNEKFSNEQIAEDCNRDRCTIIYSSAHIRELIRVKDKYVINLINKANGK